MQTARSLTTNLTDAAPDYDGGIPVRIVGNPSAISIFPDGYGDFGSAPGHGCPVFFELYEGRLRLVVFPDINEQEPLIIDLEGARELRGNDAADTPPSMTPLEEGQLYFEMQSKVNPQTGKPFTTKEVAESHGVEHATVRNLISLCQSVNPQN